MLGDGHRARARTAAAMRRRERLVGVEVHHVEARGAGPEAPQDGVHVGAVHVRQRTRGMGRVEHLHDAPLEQAERGGIGDHDRCRPRAERSAERVEVHAAIVGRWDGHGPEPGHGGRRRVGAMRRVGHDHLVPLGVAARAVVRPDDEDARELAMRSRGGLERGRMHAPDLGEHRLELPHQLEGALGKRVGRERMQPRETGQPCSGLVDARVVLHGARAERDRSPRPPSG